MNTLTSVSTSFSNGIRPIPNDWSAQRSMTESSALPLILEPDQLALQLSDDNLIIVDVRVPESCFDGFIPGAISLEYKYLVRQEGLAKGLLPTTSHLSEYFSKIGLTSDKHIVAYDDDNGAAASRLLWTLEVMGHQSFSLLNGGFGAWDEGEHPIADTLSLPVPSQYQAVTLPHNIADYHYVLSKIADRNTVILDTRSEGEYAGHDVRAHRGGHIPGAVNNDWINATDPFENFKLRNPDQISSQLLEKGVTPDKEIIVYCQTHHRSSHSYITLKHLGYPNVKAYAGSWSEWGNHVDLPIEV